MYEMPKLTGQRRTEHIALLIDTLRAMQEDNDQEGIASFLAANQHDPDLIFQVMKALGRTAPDKPLTGWAKTRLQGRRRFIWIHGVIFTGLPALIGWLIYSTFIDNRYNPYHFLGGLAFSVPASVLFGYWAGKNRWNTNENRFNSAGSDRT